MWCFNIALSQTPVTNWRMDEWCLDLINLIVALLFEVDLTFNIEKCTNRIATRTENTMQHATVFAVQ